MKKHFYGGQAVIEGVMIRGITNCVVAVRNKKKEIIINQINLPSFTNSKLKKIPFIRGLFILVEMMIIGFRSLSKSSEVLEENQEEMSLLEKLFSYVFSTVFLVIVLSVFFLLPLFLSDRVVFFENNFVVKNSSSLSTIFGLPGGAILPAYDPLYDSPIRHILARHEQGSGHMAEGYAQATGELGVVIATSFVLES